MPNRGTLSQSSAKSKSLVPARGQSRLSTLGDASPWIYAGGLLICALVICAYWPAIHGGFVMDDDGLITRSYLVHASDGLYRFWLTTEPVDYWPVTSTTF